MGLYDIVGDAEYVGDDEMGADDETGYDIVGAGKKRRMAGLAGTPKRVLSDAPDIARRQISPIPFTTIPPNGTVTVTFRPQRPIRVERLILDGVVAAGGSVAGVFLTDMLVGAEPQFVNGGAVPLSTFQPNAFGTSLKGNTAQPGIDVSLTFRNTNAGVGQDASIGGAVIGTSLT